MYQDRQEVIDLIKKRSCAKRNVYENTKRQFKVFRTVLDKYAEELANQVHSFDERLEVKYESHSDFESRLTFAGDTLVFFMHSNAFQFDAEHHIWKTSYVKEDETRAYCGIIHVYNFLADSFRMNRMNDMGYLIARIFVNKENHFLVEGRKQMGYLFNDFVNSQLDERTWEEVLNAAMHYSLDFDLFVPPYDHVVTTTVSEMSMLSTSNSLKTGKRFGFQFGMDDKDDVKG
jgi:hypothetical protein